MRVPATVVLLTSVTLLVAACGGSSEKKSVSGTDRVAACLEQQPDATKTQCEGWEKDGQLADDGTHKGHDSMDMK